VETNWVVAYAAPAHLQVPAAAQLIEKARAGKLTLHLPALCLTEARHPLRTKFQPRATADSVRKYLAWATREGKVEHDSADTIRVILDQYEATVSAELDQLDYRLQQLTQHSGIEVFALSEIMLARAVQLSTMNLDLKPFDQAILAAVLVKAEQLRDGGADDLAFCELDSDLQPWDKYGRTKQPLTALYDSASVWVYDDFAMESPLRRPTFPE
jgi:hypothetical protein